MSAAVTSKYPTLAKENSLSAERAKSHAKFGFEKQLWDAACVLWGHIPAAEYRKVIIGLIFLRYVSAAFDRRYQELLAEGEGFENYRDAYMAKNVFFVPEVDSWEKERLVP